jgi:hypothetical protein
MLALGGFLVHHFLPSTWRINFFAALSVASVPLVFGWLAGSYILAIGGLLIALCHLPVAFWIRISLIAACALGLAAAREQLLTPLVALPATVWPILGSMFMFRLIIYLYDLKHEAAPFSVGRALSYFFMLPNVCFPLFPVVDYKTLQRSAYNDDPLRLYHTGVKWMLRGLIQLVIYKGVYFLAVIEPASALNGTDAARFMIATFLLYLKISGLFHLIIGLLHMYGFGLAETHHLYLFSSSFTDFWRRINIYWKDFIQKTVFTPAYFVLRKRGETFAICIATLIAFVATWLLHSYQWFWIRGEFPIVWADIVFWLGLGGAVLVNVLLESRRGRQRSLVNGGRTLRGDALLAMKIAGTFVAICVLWTVWSTPSLVELGFLWRALLNSGPGDLTIIIGIPVCVGIVGALLRHKRREVFGNGSKGLGADIPFLFQAAAISAVSILLISFSLKPSLLRNVSPVLAELMDDIKDRNPLNEGDSKRFVRGYYEDLGDLGRFNNELGMAFGMQPPDWKGSSPRIETNSALEWQFAPSSTTIAAGAVRTINTLGLRDREYENVPPPNTFRIGLIGASHDLGLGVADDETYENIVEDRLNRELASLTSRRYEILNFSLLGTRPTQKLAIIEQRIFAHAPNLILYVASTREFEWMFRSVPHLVKNNLLDQFPFVRSAMDRAGVKPDALPDLEVLESKLAPFAEEALLATLERFRDAARSRGIVPALVLLEIPDDTRSPSKTRIGNKVFDRLVNVGQAAKLPVLNLKGSFSAVADTEELRVAPWDDHTNALGHKLLAERLYNLLLEEKLIPTAALKQ